jgi:hypothetical protein
MGYVTFYSPVVSNRTEIFEAGRESAIAARRIVSNFRAAAVATAKGETRPHPLSEVAP